MTHAAGRRAPAALVTILAIAAGAASCANDPTPYVWTPPESRADEERMTDYSAFDEARMAPWRASWNYQDPVASEAAFRASLASLEDGGHDVAGDAVSGEASSAGNSATNGSASGTVDDSVSGEARDASNDSTGDAVSDAAGNAANAAPNNAQNNAANDAANDAANNDPSDAANDAANDAATGASNDAERDDASELPSGTTVATSSEGSAASRALEASLAADRGRELRTQIARALGLQQRFDDARVELDALALELGAGGSPRVRVLLDLERGRLARSSGNVAASRGPFERAFELACATGLDYLAVDAAHMLGIVAPGDAATEWNRRALAIADASHDPGARGWGAVIANNEGWNRFEAGEHEAALELFERALVLRRERPDQVEPILVARWCVARAWRELGRAEEALTEQRALLAEREAAGAISGYEFEEIGECLLLLERDDESIPYFARAHELLSQDAWLVANEPERLERLARLAK